MVLEERYRHLFERNLTGLYIATIEGTLIDCNEACACILGYSGRAELLENRSEAEALTSQFHEPLARKARGAIRQIVNLEKNFRRRNGDWGWVLLNVRITQQENSSALLEGALIDITDRKVAEDRVRFLAYYDSLTGLANRSLLQDRLGKALASARRHHEKVAVLFLDLDRFKIINDSLGHSLGDLLLQEVAKRLNSSVREQDTVSRVGGDEFLIALTTISTPADASVAAERIVRSLSTDISIQGHTLNISCSIGISLFPEHGDDAETLIKNADAAMYGAKEGGRNTFRFFTDQMNAQVMERLTLETSLRLALERNELFLVYQPQMDLATGRITGLEALLRWHRPELGLVPPDKFIRVAENSGLILPIGEWVLRKACAQVKTWMTEGLEAVPVAVNVSAAQFRQENFCPMIREVLHETGMSPDYLELELTESLLLSNADVMFLVLQELKDMGLKLAIDDFGTGYSSLSYLRQFPVGKLKIDQCFIRDVPRNPDDAAITAAIINMAKSLNLRVIAEGVETEAQMNFLREHQCHEIQGFYLSRPLTAELVAAKLQRATPLAASIRS
jgi:diguanylate cyclase (GGDEF)-like protein/PAS domain S-box-containing protein